MTTIFISSLPFRADEGFIRGLFGPFGNVVSVEFHADWVNPTYEPYAYVELDALDPGVAGWTRWTAKNSARIIFAFTSG